MWVGGADKLTIQSNGNAYHWICDMHFTPEPNDEHTAECEYVDP
jgi:hypothetical protein